VNAAGLEGDGGDGGVVVNPIAGMRETGGVRILGDSDLLGQTARFSTNHGTLWIHPYRSDGGPVEDGRHVGFDDDTILVRLIW
jgi:hypothetical protein